MTKLIYFKGFWTVTDVQNRPEYLFIYGDNNAKIGKKGQAIIRSEPNTMGIPTKRYPTNALRSFYSDVDYKDNCKRIKEAINKIIEESATYEAIVFPENGFGTGLADLQNKAPETYAYLQKAIAYVITQLEGD